MVSNMSQSERAVVVIPARFASSRYPGKPLVKLLGKPMILWVAELAEKAIGQENVYIATDDERIKSVVEDAGFKTVMTGPALTGTDRLAQAAEQIDADIFINVQGDEPLADPSDILKVLDQKQSHPEFVINGFSYLNDDEDPSNINIPKVITTEDDRLVYMSRAPIPGFKDHENAPKRYKKQVCIYAFSKHELSAFGSLTRKSLLEKSEDIEILRFLEFGKTIKMIETKPGSYAVDAPSDVEIVEEAMKSRGFKNETL
ncbi:3-deoxy-manno-octulosonate cytidylyltransferase [uncultured Alteromonas sp.]|uniref:3-deoxy-manno-octulosonate cytidylyltransferase n=1 Tax=uncultured Alteromonas sp. TaxID=179113 RepID=UPI0030D98CCB